MFVDRTRREVTRAAAGADIHSTCRGYTLTVYRREGAFPVLIAGTDGHEPRLWRSLDSALAFLIEQYGPVASIRLRLHGD